jgi:hypothetical protein
MRLNALRACAILLAITLNEGAFVGERVETKHGAVEGTAQKDGLRSFRGTHIDRTAQRHILGLGGPKEGGRIRSDCTDAPVRVIANHGLSAQN